MSTKLSKLADTFAAKLEIEKNSDNQPSYSREELLAFAAEKKEKEEKKKSKLEKKVKKLEKKATLKKMAVEDPDKYAELKAEKKEKKSKKKAEKKSKKADKKVEKVKKKLFNFDKKD